MYTVNDDAGCGCVYVWHSSSFCYEGIIDYVQYKESREVSSRLNPTERIYVHHMQGGVCTK